MDDARARKNASTLLQQLASKGQARVGEALEVNESTVSRKAADADSLGRFLAACGLKVVPVEMQCYPPSYIESLRVMAEVGIKAPPPGDLEWEQGY